MDEILAQLFPQAPSYFPGLLGQEQANLLQQQAQRQGLLGIGMGLLQAAAPSTTRTSLGAGIAQGLSTGQQMAQNVYAQRLQEQQIAQKLAEQQRSLQQQAQMRQLFPQVFQTTTERGAIAGEEGPVPTAQQRISIDPSRLSMLAAAAPDPLAALANVSKIIPELRKGGVLGGMVTGADPFAPFLASENPNIRAVAQQYSRAYQTGAIDEATAGQRAESLGRMAETSAKPPSSIQEYNYDMAQRRQQGLPEVAFGAWQIEKARSNAPQINLPAERAKKLFAEIDVEAVKGFSNAAQASREIAQTSEAINRLLEGAGGGRAVEVGTSIQRALGLNSPTVTADDLARSLAIRAATQVRAPSSGSTSNIEFAAYLQAVPTLATSKEGRTLMTEFSRARAIRDAKLSDYARKLARDDEYSEEAMSQFDESLGPVMTQSMLNRLQSLTTVAPPSTTQPGTVDFRTRQRP